MKSREPIDRLPGIGALRNELEILNQEALRRDDKARAEEREAREEELRRAAESEAVAKQELSHWLIRERFALVVIGLGIAFGILLTFLPAAPGKIAMYGCALVCVLLGARQKDQAQKRISAILPKLPVEELVRLRAKKW